MKTVVSKKKTHCTPQAPGPVGDHEEASGMQAGPLCLPPAFVEAQTVAGQARDWTKEQGNQGNVQILAPTLKALGLSGAILKSSPHDVGSHRRLWS